MHIMMMRDIHHKPAEAMGGGDKGKEEEIKEGKRDVVIQEWGRGLLLALRIKQQT